MPSISPTKIPGDCARAVAVAAVIHRPQHATREIILSGQGAMERERQGLFADPAATHAAQRPQVTGITSASRQGRRPLGESRPSTPRDLHWSSLPVSEVLLRARPAGSFPR